MTSSRSTFYIATPNPPSQRHSMFVDHTELERNTKQNQDLSSASSSATLPSTAGSVDRLTGLGERKKTPRFFTLKPKTSFSLRPFFSSSSISSSSNSSKRHQKSTKTSTSTYVQTDEAAQSYDEVGVQTQNASTVDVPVQTCFTEWDDDKYSYGRRPFAGGAYRSVFSRWPSAEYTFNPPSSNLLKPSIPASETLADIKHPSAASSSSPEPLPNAPPFDSASKKTAFNRTEIRKPPDVPVASENTPKCSSAKYFSSGNLTTSNENSTVTSSKPLIPISLIQSHLQSSNDTPKVTPNRLHLLQTENVSKLAADTSKIPSLDETEKDNKSHSEVSAKLIVLSSPSERLPSALKIERSDSPVKHSAKIKTVHFELLPPEVKTPDVCTKKTPLINSTTLDKDFEELLRNLNILTDDPFNSSKPPDDENLKIPSNSISSGMPLKQTALANKIKSAFEISNYDVLPPILETSNETLEIEPPVLTKYNEPISENERKNNELNLTQDIPSSNFVADSVHSFQKNKFPPTCKQNKDENKLKGLEDTRLETASSVIFIHSKLNSDVANDGNFKNDDDSKIEENDIKDIALPTLPSFFDSSLKCIAPESDGIVNDEGNVMTTYKEFSKDKCNGNTLLWGSSSSTSISGKNNTDFSSFTDSKIRNMECCGNLNYLKEGTIHICEPNRNNLEKNRDLVQCTTMGPMSYDMKGSNAAHTRGAVLDRLFDSGSEISVANKQDERTSPMQPIVAQQGKINTRQATKHVATLMKFDSNTIGDPRESDFFSSHSNSISSFDTPLTPFDNNNNKDSFISSELGNISKFVTKPIGSVHEQSKNHSVFLFSENDSLKFGVTENLSSSTSPEQGKTFGCHQLSDVSDFTKAVHHDLIENNIIPDTSSRGACDFTNCLRPSEIQNSSFLSKINSTTVPSQSYPEWLNDQHIYSKHLTESENSNTKISNDNQQCDYAHCLKPSEVNSNGFKAALSENIANKSSNPDYARTNSPLTTRTNTPPFCLPKNPTKKLDEVSVPKDIAPTEDVNHTSKLTIVLQTPSRRDAPQSQMQYETISPSIDRERAEQPPVYCIKKEIQLESPKVSSKQWSLASLEKCNEETKSELTRSEVPPPPPPPPTTSTRKFPLIHNKAESKERLPSSPILKLSSPSAPNEPRCNSTRTPVMCELENHFQNQRNCHDRRNQEHSDVSSQSSFSSDSQQEIENIFKDNSLTRNECNGNNGFSPQHRESFSPTFNGKSDRFISKQTFPSKTHMTDDPLPLGAILVDERITVDGDKVHTDKYYAIPVKEVCKETTSTTKFIPAPPKYEGIGPTEDGIPTGLRNSVKKENMHNWYKTMFKNLHKMDSSNDPQEYVIGYSSEPETNKREKASWKKSATLDNRSGHYSVKSTDNIHNQVYPPSAKSSIDVYNVQPRLIEDYEPGNSSVTDDEITIGYKRYLPALNTPKSSYEFKNGYEQENNFIRNLSPSESPDFEQQKVWYKEVQKGYDIPQFGLGKPAPEKLKDPVIGPLPPPPLNYHGPISPQQATRPLTLPKNYQNDGLCQQSNGPYEIQMRQVLHTELQQRTSPSPYQLSPHSRSIIKSPSRSPDLKLPARALFDFKTETIKEIPLKKGDLVLVLRQLDKNWYEGEHKGRIGIFPVSYVEIIPPEHVSTPLKVSVEGIGKVLYDFIAHSTVELSVHKGDTVRLLKTVDSNWYEAQLNVKKGIIPASYLQVIREPHERDATSPSKPCLRSPRDHSETRNGVNKTSPMCLNNNKSPPGRVTFQIKGKKSSSLIEPVMYKALYSYSPQNSDELELSEGDVIYVVEMCDDGWFVGTSVRTGIFGIFPGNYVEKV